MPNEAKKKLKNIIRSHQMEKMLEHKNQVTRYIPSHMMKNYTIDIPKNYIIILEENNDYSYICLIIGIINYTKIFKINKSQMDKLKNNLESFKIIDSIKGPLFYYKLLEEYKLKDEMKINLTSTTPHIDSTFYKLINNNQK
jgi:hypothetical protein